jgi:hypothetical protein
VPLGERMDHTPCDCLASPSRCHCGVCSFAAGRGETRDASAFRSAGAEAGATPRPGMHVVNGWVVRVSGSTGCMEGVGGTGSCCLPKAVVSPRLLLQPVSPRSAAPGLCFLYIAYLLFLLLLLLVVVTCAHTMAHCKQMPMFCDTSARWGIGVQWAFRSILHGMAGDMAHDN